MADSDRTPNFPPLNGKNAISWFLRMEAHLIRKQLYSQVVTYTGDVSGLTQVEIDEAWDKWRKARDGDKVLEAYAEMVLRVEDSQLVHMRSKDPEVIWDTLTQVHRARGLATRLALRRRFLSSVKREKEVMSDWIGRIQAQAYELEDADVNTTDEDTILALTMGLDRSFESFIISLDATDPSQLTLDYVIGRLLNEEVRRGNQGVNVAGEQGVMVKQEASEALVVAGDRGPPVCWRCGKVGHEKKFCKEEPARGKKQESASAAVESTHSINFAF